jgi:hypothetical protein
MELDKEATIPFAMLTIAAILCVAFGFYAAGPKGPNIALMLVGTHMVIGVVLGVIGCSITASIMGISFGYLYTAILKLAAIYALPTAISLFIPYYVGWIVAFVLYFAMLAWLFDLEGKEITICAGVIWLVHRIASMLAAIIVGMIV